MYKLGIDVGGTNTDAVLINENLEVAAALKHPTGSNLYEGILGAVGDLLAASGVAPGEIRQAMLGTAQCANAIRERKALEPVAVLRIGAPAMLGIPPMLDWDQGLKAAAKEVAVIGGGFEFDGRELAPFDEAAARAFFESIKGRIRSVAISCVFSPVRDDHEKRAAALCREILGPEAHISISSEIGSMGLIERENAAILNAALYQVAESFTGGFERSLKELGVNQADIYFTQNDGTLMTMAYARRYPILTIACGPTNSIRGASYLSKLQDAVVIDVGGATTSLGVLRHGLPRDSGAAVTIGGVRTNFRMPQMATIALGGGSVVRAAGDGTVTVGPDSVGYRITEEALVFGGPVLTATDIAVRLGMADVGDASKVSHISAGLAKNALEAITGRLEECLDALKPSGAPVDVILVGGGSIILPDKLAGAANVVKPPHSGFANAVGAAAARVSGTYEKLVSYDEIPRERALDIAKAEAAKLAVIAGAKPGTVKIIDVEDMPLAYYAGSTCRVRVKAAGDLL